RCCSAGPILFRASRCECAVFLPAATGLVLVLAPVSRPPCADPTLPCPALIGAAPPIRRAASDQASGTVVRFGQTHVAAGASWQLDFDPRYWTLDTSDPSGAIWMT